MHCLIILSSFTYIYIYLFFTPTLAVKLCFCSFTPLVLDLFAFVS